jgi:hypothetical protein
MLDRTAIRRRAIDALTAAGMTVHDSKITSWAIEDLPGVSVYIASQRNQIGAASQTNCYAATATLNVEIAMAATDNWSDKLDDFSEKIENVILRDQGLYNLGHIANCAMNMKFQPDGEQPVMSAVMSFDFEFFVENKPVPSDDFNTAEMDVTVGAENKIHIRIKPNQGV